MNIEELIEHCIRKDGSVWDEFIRQYQGLVRTAAYYRLNNVLKNDAEKISNIFTSIPDYDIFTFVNGELINEKKC